MNRARLSREVCDRPEWRRDNGGLKDMSCRVALPWIHRKNLASRIVALVSRRLPDDWQARYAYRPALLETFVEKPRFTGTCYKAANWRHLGDTQGRGKLDVLDRKVQPIKSIWIYPLMRDCQRQLCNG